MIHGCAQKEPDVVNLTAISCPPISARDERTLTQRPAKPPVSGDLRPENVREWVDRLDGQVLEMSQAGRRVIRQHNQCVAGASS
jgi:hypothetical protein